MPIRKRRKEKFFMKKAVNNSDICHVVFESANDIIVFVDRKGTIVEINDRVKGILGYKKDEIKGKNFAELPTVFPEDLASYAREFKGMSRKKKLLMKLGMNVPTVELRLRHKNGTSVYVEASTRILKTKVRGCCIMSIIRDITRRKKAEQALKDVHARFEKFMDSATEGFVLTDANLNVLDVNAYLLAEFNLKKEKVIGANILDFSGGAYESGTFQRLMEVIETGKALSYETLSPPNLANKYLAIKVFKVGDGLGMTVRDISDHKRKEIALMESEDRFRTLYESVHAGLMVIDNDGEITHINKIACEVMDVSPSEVLGERSVSFFSSAVDDSLKPIAPENNPLVNLSVTPVKNQVIGIHFENPARMIWLLVNTEPVIDHVTRKIDELIVTFVKLTGRKGKANHAHH